MKSLGSPWRDCFTGIEYRTLDHTTKFGYSLFGLGNVIMMHPLCWFNWHTLEAHQKRCAASVNFIEVKGP